MKMGIDELGQVVVVPGAGDGTADIYDIATGRRTAELAGYDSSWKVQSATKLALSTRHNIVVAQLCDDIVLWDVANGSLSYLRTGDQSHASIAIDHASSELICTDSNTITRWDLSTPKPLRQYRAVAPQSATLYEAHRLLVSGGVDGYIATWNLDAPPAPQVVGHAKAVRQIHMGSNRQLLLSLSEDQLCIWSETGSLAEFLLNEEAYIYLDEEGRVVPRATVCGGPFQSRL